MTTLADRLMEIAAAPDPIGEPSMAQWETIREAAVVLREAEQALAKLDAVLDFNKPYGANEATVIEDPTAINAAFAEAACVHAKLIWE